MDKLHSFNFISFSSVDAYSGAIARKNAGARKKQRTCAAVAVFALLFGLAGCSQSSGSTSDKAVNEIQKEKSEEKNLTVAPQKITVKAGVSQLFTALDDDNQPAEGVVWSIHGASAGDSAIQSTGWLTIADDASGVITVTATAGSASGYADVAISDEPPEYDDPTSPPPPINWGMSVAPSSVELPAGGMQTFAAITGGKVSEDNITWTIEGHTSKDTSITKGVLNIGADEEAAWITVRAAASKDDEFGTALVTIKSAAGNPADDPAGDNSGTPEKPAIPDGGGGGSASITVSIIEPYTRDIKKGQSNNFSLTVNQSAGGSYQVAQVIWNVSGAKSADTSIDSGGRLFIAEGESATTLNISADFAGATSNIVPINVIPDLSKWESASSVFTGLSGNIIAIARSDNMLVFLSDTSTVYPYTYTDGDFKVEDGVTLSGLKSEEKISTIAYGGKGAAAYFVAGGDKGTLLYSQDAKTWRKAGGDDFSGAVNRIRYLDGEINTFVALCSNDAIFSAPTGSMDTWTKTIFSFDGALSFSDIIIVEGASSVALICNDRYDNKDYGVIYTAEIKSKFNDLSWSRPHRVSETGAILSLAASVPGTNEFAVAGNNRLYIYTYDGAAISDPVSDDDPGFYSVNDMLFQKIGDGYIYFITASIGGIQYLENGVDIQTISPITNDALYWLNAITYFKPVNKFIAAGYSGYVVFTK